MIKQVIKIVVENENPKKWLKKQKNEVQGGGRKREGSVGVAWGERGVCVKCAWRVREVCLRGRRGG